MLLSLCPDCVATGKLLACSHIQIIRQKMCQGRVTLLPNAAHTLAYSSLHAIFGKQLWAAAHDHHSHRSLGCTHINLTSEAAHINNAS